MASKITVFKNGRKVRGKKSARRPRVQMGPAGVTRVRQTGFITGHTASPQEIRDRAIAGNLPDLPASVGLIDESIGGPINHPRHYNEHPSGVECISIIRWETHNLGAAVAHIWRIRSKPLLKQIEDLKKAEFYLHDEIERLEDMARELVAKGVTQSADGS